MNDWYYKVEGAEFGPVTRAELEALAAKGALGPDDSVRQGLSGPWMFASESVFHEPATAPQPPAENGGDQLGGWLILPMLGLFISPFMNIYTLWQEIQMFSHPDLEHIRAQVPAFLEVLTLEVLAIVFATGLGLVCLVKFLGRKQSTPKLMIALYVTNLVINFGSESWIAGMAPEEASFTGTGRSVVACLIWIPYFLVSKRVKRTFVR